MAWLLRNVRIRQMQEEGGKLLGKLRKLSESNDNLEIEKIKAEERLENCEHSKQGMVSQEELSKALSDLKMEKERSMTARSSLTEIESAHEALKRELEIKIGQMISQEEATRLQAEANRLKVFNASLQEEISQLKAKERVTEEGSSDDSLLDEDSENGFYETSPFEEEESDTLTGEVEEFELPTETVSEEKVGEKGYAFLQTAGIKSAASGEQDDLKLISGVGPFIEKKLNDIGIYTFEQIASLSIEQTEMITEAIEFFPGRIQRDDWVGQAQQLM